MKKILKRVLALTFAGVIALSGCGASPLKSNFKYAEGYAKVSAPTEFTTVEKSNGNVGDVSIESGDTYAVIRVEKYGDIKIKLFPEEAPYAVQNFIDLAMNGYFEGKNIHRVISDFMIQGGSLNGDGTGGTSADGGEFSCEVNGNMRHFYGALCYANAGGKNTCQFYIVNNKAPQEVTADFYNEYVEYYPVMAEAYKKEGAKYEEDSEAFVYYNTMAANYENMGKGAELMRDKLTDEISAKYADIGGVPFLDGGYTVFGQTVEGFEVIDKISAAETVMGADDSQSSPVEEIIISTVAIMTAE